MDSRDRARNASSALAHTRFGSVRWVDEVGSTNRVLLEEARSGAPEGSVLASDHQTAGRGRRGRTWTDPPAGSLLVSVLIRPGIASEQLGLTTIAFGLAAVDACRAQGIDGVGLKWPNDLVTTGVEADRKVAGILSEVEFGDGREHPAVVIGMGCNVNWAGWSPPVEPTHADALRPAALDELAGREIDRTALLIGLFEAFEHWYSLVISKSGRAAVIDAHVERSATLGRAVRVESPTGTAFGRAVGLDDGGRLLFVPADSAPGTAPSVLVAGDVVHLRPTD